MSNLEHKFSDLRIHIDAEIHHIKQVTEKSITDHEEKIAIVESNVDDIHSQVEYLQSEIEKSGSRITDCENRLLDFAEIAGDLSFDGAETSGNAKKIRKF